MAAVSNIHVRGLHLFSVMALKRMWAFPAGAGNGGRVRGEELLRQRLGLTLGEVYSTVSTRQDVRQAPF